MSLAKTSEAITELMKVTPNTARKYTEEGTILEVETTELKVGDRLQVRKGSNTHRWHFRKCGCGFQ